MTDNLAWRSELGVNGRSVTFGYDNLSRLNQVQRSTDTFAYTYKSNGSQLDHIQLPNGTKSTFDYDTLGRLTQVQDLNSSSANISKFNYGYDNRDVKTYMERALGTATTQHVDYSYDDIDELVSEVSNEVTPLVNNSYDYDAAQNRTASTVDSASSSFTLNNVNQISAYTLSGTPVTVTCDDNGNTTQLGPKTLTWDDANRLTSVTVPGVSKSEYQYDGLNRRRIAKAYTWNSGTSDWDLQSERRFIYDGMDLIEERDGSNNLIAFYTRDGNIGGVLSRTTDSATFYYHYDGNGNVVSLTDSSENVVATYEYDAYGNLTDMSGSQAADNPIRFSTKYFDSDTGYYDFGFRSYDPVTGRWLNRDPIGEDGGINLYVFVGNGPGNSWDEYGLSKGLVVIWIGKMEQIRIRMRINFLNLFIMKWRVLQKDYVKRVMM